VNTPERRALAAALIAHLDRLAAPFPPDDPEGLGADAAFRAAVDRLSSSPEDLTDEELVPLERAAAGLLARYASAGLTDGALFAKLVAAGEIRGEGRGEERGAARRGKEWTRNATAASVASRHPNLEADRAEASALHAQGLNPRQIADLMDSPERPVYERKVRRWLKADATS
jgi:hypothetical protein